MSGVGVGAGLMYLLGHIGRGREESPRGAAAGAPKGRRPAPGRRKRPASRAKTG